MIPFRKIYRISTLISILLPTLLLACQSNQPSAHVQACNTQGLPKNQFLTRSTVSSHQVYVSSGTHLYALNAGNGSVQWCVNYVALSPGALLGHLTLKGQLLYASVEDGEIAAFNTSSGTLRWSAYVGAVSNQGSPPVDKDLIYGGNLGISALNIQDGSVRWHYALPEGAMVTSVRNVPTVANGMIYFGTSTCCPPHGGSQTAVYALDATTGAKRWVEQWSSSDEKAPVRINQTPVVEQGIVCVFVENITGGTIQALDAQTGKHLWQHPVSNLRMLQAANGLLYVGDGKKLSALSVQDGAVRWSVPYDITHMFVLDGTLYGELVEGPLLALNAKDGSLRWQTSLKNGLQTRVSSMILLDDELYVGAVGLEGRGPYMLQALNTSSGTENWNASFPGVSPEVMGIAA